MTEPITQQLINVDSVRPIADVLERAGWKPVWEKQIPMSFAWGRGPQEKLAMTSESMQVVVTCMGTLIVRVPSLGGAPWRQTRYIDCASPDDVITELARAGIVDADRVLRTRLDDPGVKARLGEQLAGLLGRTATVRRRQVDDIVAAVRNATGVR